MINKIKTFFELTAIDFVDCYRDYPNVMIWCALIFLIALFV